jgi:hypothetical protein
MASAGFKVTHTPYSKLAVSLKERTNSQSKVNVGDLIGQKTVFSGLQPPKFPKTR